MVSNERKLNASVKIIEAGGTEKYHKKLSESAKLFVRDRLKLLFDNGKFQVEDSRFANYDAGDLPADGVITAIGKVGGQTVCVMANDSTVKAGSWGHRRLKKLFVSRKPLKN